MNPPILDIDQIRQMPVGPDGGYSLTTRVNVPFLYFLDGVTQSRFSKDLAQMTVDPEIELRGIDYKPIGVTKNGDVVIILSASAFIIDDDPEEPIVCHRCDHPAHTMNICSVMFCDCGRGRARKNKRNPDESRREAERRWKRRGR